VGIHRPSKTLEVSAQIPYRTDRYEVFAYVLPEFYHDGIAFATTWETPITGRTALNRDAVNTHVLPHMGDTDLVGALEGPTISGSVADPYDRILAFWVDQRSDHAIVRSYPITQLQ
jgi:hypothetical protein